MVRVDAVIHPTRLDEVKSALGELGISNITWQEVLRHDPSAPPTASYRGVPYRVDVPRVKIELLLSSLQVDEVVGAILRSGRTGNAAEDGTITIFEVADAIRIENGERVRFVLS